MNKNEMKTLIDKARRGDVDAFDELYRTYATHILYQVRLFLNNKGEVEDAAQEVVYKMFTNFYQLKSSFAFSVWLHRIIKSVCYERNNKYAKDTALQNIDDYEDTLHESSTELLPENKAITKDRNGLLREIIGELPQNQRLAIIMYYFDEMSYKEIASAMDVTVSTVSTNIVKAKMRIKEKFEKRYKDEASGDTELLAGIAIGPALASAIAEDAAIAFPAVKVQAFCNVCDSGIKGIASGAASSGAHAGGIGLKAIITSKVMTIASVACIATAAVAIPVTVSVVQSNDVTQEATPAAVSEPAAPYLPKAEISLVSDSENSQVNPLQATLNIEDSQSNIAGWSIVSKNDEETALNKGSGDTIKEELTKLAPGEYKILWTVENGSGGSATVKRGFTIIDAVDSDL
jgi:RNA polymerase sigma-70 factor (ECF subfamily)